MIGRHMAVVLAVAALGLGGWPAFGQSSESLAFVQVTVLPMDSERVLRDRTVVVGDGRVLAVGPAETTPIPEGAVRIDGAGKYLIPGLADMHVHLMGEAWNLMLPPAEQVRGDALDLEPFLFPYIANGVTTVQVLSATPDHLALRRRLLAGELLGPRLVLSRMIDAPERAWPPPLSTWVGSPAEARAAVLAAAEAGYDSMKVYSFLDRERYGAIVDAAAEAGMAVIGHIPLDLTLNDVLSAGQLMIAHSEEVTRQANGDFSAARIAALASAVADSETWLVPTLVTSRTIIGLFDDLDGTLTRPEARYFRHPIQRGAWSFMVQNLYLPIPEEHRQTIREGFWEFQRPFVAELSARGARLLAGTDSGLPGLVPGFALHRELEELVAAGLTPYEALRTATTHPFDYLGERQVAGTIEVGQRGDLVLLDADPLAEISNSRKIAGVVVGGRWLSRRDLDAGLARVAGDALAQ